MPNVTVPVGVGTRNEDDSPVSFTELAGQHTYTLVAPYSLYTGYRESTNLASAAFKASEQGWKHRISRYNLMQGG